VKSNLTRPFQRAAGGGKPGGNSGEKSNAAELIAMTRLSSGVFHYVSTLGHTDREL
jgi:hypothetical protein